MTKHKICGTCYWVFPIKRDDGKPPRDGYCYARPPFLSSIYPKVGLHRRACGFHMDKPKDIEETTTREE